MTDNEYEKVLPAKLVEGEPVISAEYAEKAKAVIEEVKNTAEKAIKSPEPKADGKPSISYSSDGVMTSGKTDATPKPKAKAPKPKEEKKVAIYSTRNVRWYEVGKVVKGYNIVSESEAKKWLERDHIRLVEPEEVKREFDN